MNLGVYKEKLCYLISRRSASGGEEAADNLEFERAIELRDELKRVKEEARLI